jgi:SOS-response transcriptional repressor LexA
MYGLVALPDSSAQTHTKNCRSIHWTDSTHLVNPPLTVSASTVNQKQGDFRMYDDVPEDKLSDVSVHAGFPNPAADTDRRGSGLSLDQLLLTHPSSTYLFRLAGHAWASEGIGDGDIAVVDRALQATAQDMVIAWRDDEFLLVRRQKLPAGITPWGIVTAIVHHYRKPGN